MPPQPPDHLARKYAMLYERAITPILALFAHNARDIQRRSDSSVPIFKNIEQLKVHYADLIETALHPVVNALIDDVNTDNKQKISAVWRQVVGVPFTDTPEMEAKLAQHRFNNVSLIRGLAGDALDRVHKAINETQGQHTHDVTKAIVEAIGVGQSRARLIARDQTLKINGNLTKERHESVGVTKYEWVTSSDERVRPMHRELNGMVFEWDKPPKISKDNRHEHPGGDFQCRCTANPIIDLDEIEAKAAPVVPVSPVVAPSESESEGFPGLPSWFHIPYENLTPEQKKELVLLPTQVQLAHGPLAHGAPVPKSILAKLKKADPEAAAFYEHIKKASEKLDVKKKPKPVPAPAVHPVTQHATAPKLDPIVPVSPDTPPVVVQPEPQPTPVAVSKPVPDTSPATEEAPPEDKSIPGLPSWFHIPYENLTPEQKKELVLLPTQVQLAHGPLAHGAPVPKSILAKLKSGEYEGHELYEHIKKASDKFGAAVAAKPKPVPAPVAHPVTQHVTAPKSAPVTPVDLAPIQLKVPRVEMKGAVFSPPPLPKTKASSRKLDKQPKPDAYASFLDMPIDSNIDGHDLKKHTRLLYPENRVDSDFSQGLKDATNAVIGTLTPEEMAAVQGYTGPDYAMINTYLRKSPEEFNKQYGQGFVKVAHERAVKAAEGISKLPKPPPDMVLFRGLRVSVNSGTTALDELAIAKEIEIPQFLSTSRDPKVGFGFSVNAQAGGDYNVVYRIKKHKSGAMIDAVSVVEAESEVLFPPGVKFRIVGRQRVNNNTLVVDLEEV